MKKINKISPKATITSVEDIVLKGAVVSTNDLEVNAGRDLAMESVQDIQSIKGESKVYQTYITHQ
ncbi:hemagglutinin repeat-containing protein [Sulfurimonas sp.]|uniref:hemagglutinin repeat-containing protein n=1 Tax=Sulfurimonas sp. TaxID=2022749 RepID=UPI003456998F